MFKILGAKVFEEKTKEMAPVLPEVCRIVEASLPADPLILSDYCETHEDYCIGACDVITMAIRSPIGDKNGDLYIDESEFR